MQINKKKCVLLIPLDMFLLNFQEKSEIQGKFTCTVFLINFLVINLLEKYTVGNAKYGWIIVSRDYSNKITCFGGQHCKCKIIFILIFHFLLFD